MPLEDEEAEQHEEPQNTVTGNTIGLDVALPDVWENSARAGDDPANSDTHSTRSELGANAGRLTPLPEYTSIPPPNETIEVNTTEDASPSASMSSIVLRELYPLAAWAYDRLGTPEALGSIGLWVTAFFGLLVVIKMAWGHLFG